jgi:hypothetical protein
VPKKDLDEWIQKARTSQQNTVFPGTVQNEADGWRNLVTGKRRLTLVQCVAVGLLYLGMGVVFWGMIELKLHDSAPTSSVVDRLVAVFGDWAILFFICGMFFLLLRWRVRHALLSGKVREDHHQM